MNLRIIVAAVLLAFVLAGVIVLVVDERNAGDPEESSAESLRAANDPALGPGHHLIAYYFHGDQRCESCRKIEAYTEEALRAGFPAELERGGLAWRVVNVDRPENEHFVEEYGLTTRTVVLVEMQDGRRVKWVTLGGVWNHLDDQAAFIDYIQRETREVLGG